MKSKFVYIALVLLAIPTMAFASDVPSDPKKQTSWGLYVDSKETYEMKQKLGEQMLFVDVRDPIEIMFTGFTDVADINIPFKLADRNQWNSKKPVFAMVENPNFERDIEAALVARGLSKQVPIVIMCRSGGTRGAPATKLLKNKGYENVYVVTDGFEGGTVKDGERKNWRLKNGWKNSGLPWSYKLNKEKMYLSET
jgi:rhodanese-related sulfurtransferase